MILFKKRITKALISLCGRAGWSAPLLFANPEDRFSRVEAHKIGSTKEAPTWNGQYKTNEWLNMFDGTSLILYSDEDQSKEEGNYQESIQSNTTHGPGLHIGK